MEEEGIWLSKEEYDKITKMIDNFSSTQRVSSIILWIGLIMVALHIVADIGFHL